MKALRVAGVPEHFNLPLVQLAEKSPELLTWTAYAGGTGAMMRAVEDDDVDMALVLTEGAVARSATQGATRILATWVESPLEWGVHVRADAVEGAPADLLLGRIGISRYGSGSHLMPLVHAQRVGCDPRVLRFVEVGNLAGAREAFERDEIDVFYWERTMTLPLVESGEWKRAGVFEASWPAFVATLRADAAPDKIAAAVALLARLETQVHTWRHDERALVREVVAAHGLPESEVERWLARTTWRPGAPLGAEELASIIDAEIAAGILSERPEYGDIVFS